MSSAENDPSLSVQWRVSTVYSCVLNFMLLSLFPFLSLATLSHPVQNLSTPVMVQIVPINDNDPVITVEMTETDYEENAPPQPVLADIMITDEDEYCENDQLSAATVQVITLTEDSQSDQLMVRVCLNIMLYSVKI